MTSLSEGNTEKWTVCKVQWTWETENLLFYSKAHTLHTTASICQSLKDQRLEDLLYSGRQCWQMQQEKATWGKQHHGMGVMQTKSRSDWPPRAVKDTTVQPEDCGSTVALASFQVERWESTPMLSHYVRRSSTEARRSWLKPKVRNPNENLNIGHYSQ